MKEELEEIGRTLREWTRKYKKDYVTMTVVNDNVTANVSLDDKDYNKLDIYISDELERWGENE